MAESLADHWDQLFRSRSDRTLGWWEEEATPMLALLDEVPHWRDATIFLPGIGTSRLAEALLPEASHLVLNDISRVALDRLRDRLGPLAERATWLCQDIAEPLPPTLPPVQLWVDRAVLHFLRDESAIQGYFDNLRRLLQPGGHALFAEFAPDGAEYCAALPVHRYGAASLAERLGSDFVLRRTHDYTYINPRGEPRPYVYALFARTLAVPVP